MVANQLTEPEVQIQMQELQVHVKHLEKVMWGGGGRGLVGGGGKQMEGGREGGKRIGVVEAAGCTIQ